MESKEQFQLRGYVVNKDFLSPQECEYYLSLIQNYRRQAIVPEIYRNTKPIPLRYAVIDGARVKSDLKEIQQLYETVNTIVNDLMHQKLAPLADVKVPCNVNITKKGGTYRWHYDRNAITALLYLNQVDGGEIEFYPNHRITLPKAKFSRLQGHLDQLMQYHIVRNTLGQRILVKPQPGLLLIMCGDKCLHSVRPVTGTQDRINIVMAYDYPDASFEIQSQLNTYLYSTELVKRSDPNYS